MTATELTSGAAGPSPPAAPPAPQPTSSLRSVWLVTILTFGQLVLQFGIQLVLAKYFGAAGEMDAYVAAFALPTVIASILSGPLGYVLVPVVAERLAAGQVRDAATVASQIGLYLLGLSLLLTALVAIAAGPLITVLCPGFVAEKRQLAVELLSILAALIVANGLVAYLNALYQAYRQFAMPPIAGVIGPLVTLCYVIALHERQGIHAVAWGVVVGAGATAAMLLPLFLRQIWSSDAWRPRMHPGTRKCLWLLVPLLVGASYCRLDPLVDRFLGSHLPPGSLAHLGYAGRLLNGLMLIGTSGLSIVAFPAIAAHAAVGRRAELNAELAYAIRFFLVLVVPVCVGLVGFRLPVVRLLFEHGRFTSADTQAVALLIGLSVGMMFGAGLGDLLARTFYALHDTRTPVIVHAVNFTLAAALKFLVVGAWGAAGLVAAGSAYYLLNSIVLVAILLPRLGEGMLAKTPMTLLKSLASSIVASLAAAVMLRMPVSWVVVPAAAVGTAVYLLMMWLFRDEFALKLQQAVTRGWAR